MNVFRSYPAVLIVAGMIASTGAFASSHREAPITALDHKADITDMYAFVSYGPNQAPNTTPSMVTLILCVDPLLRRRGVACGCSGFALFAPVSTSPRLLTQPAMCRFLSR